MWSSKLFFYKIIFNIYIYIYIYPSLKIVNIYEAKKLKSGVVFFFFQGGVNFKAYGYCKWVYFELEKLKYV